MSSLNNNKIIIITFFLYSASYTHSTRVNQKERESKRSRKKIIIIFIQVKLLYNIRAQEQHTKKKLFEDQKTHFFFLSKKPEFNSFEFLLREARGRDFVRREKKIIKKKQKKNKKKFIFCEI